MTNYPITMKGVNYHVNRKASVIGQKNRYRIFSQRTSFIKGNLKKIGHEKSSEMFGVILTDNETEFSNPSAIENYTVTDESTGEVTSTERTKVFYCHSSAPYEKGACERNHEFIRYFVPKGKSFESYSQSDITKMMNHINSYRSDNKKMNPKVPASRFIALYGEEIATKLSITVIDPNSVILNGSLFNTK